MSVSVDIEIASDGDDPPEPNSMNRWLRAVFERELPADDPREVEVSVRVVDCEESQTLNKHYRQKDAPTNVLSFPSDLPPDLPFRHLGDIVLCAPVIRDEAGEQGKPINDHWAHMLVHGVLHLLGYDHIEEADAAEMEALEVDILSQLGVADPYQLPPTCSEQSQQ
jgi:probable rRNA maturation factor